MHHAGAVYVRALGAPPRISVHGQGHASAPADALRVTVALYGQIHPGDEDRATRAIAQAGLGPATITTPPMFGFDAMRVPVANVVIDVRPPTRDRLNEAIAIGSRILTQFGSLRPQGTTLIVLAKDCRALVREARRAALADAAAQARDIAASAHLALGAITGVADFGTNNCVAKDAPVVPNGQSDAFEREAKVHVSSTVFVTYGVRGAR